MTISEASIPVNPYSRAGKPARKIQALIIHWTATPGQSVRGVQAYYVGRARGGDGYGGAHYAIDHSGEILRMIPEAEVAYHCGTTKLDPASKKFYTDAARAKFGQYATDHLDLSPNLVTLGIEHCVLDADGAMTPACVDASVELAADICRRHGLDPETDLWLHQEVVGWKDCHKWYLDHPADWAAYKARVRAAL